MADGHAKPHAIMIAFMYQGHITPLINLALKLASNGFRITFVNLEFIHQMLYEAHITKEEAVLFSEACKSGLDIRYMTISDGFPLEFDRILNFEEYWESMFRDFPARVDELVGKIVESDPSPPSFLIADTFYPWPATIASKYNLVNVSIWTQPAIVFSIYYHLDLLKENGHFPPKDTCEDNIVDYIPGVEPIITKDLMSQLQETDTTTMTHQIVLKAFDQVKHADIILCNTVEELEHKTLLALNEKQPIYAIGPIGFSTDFTSATVPKSLWLESDCAEWLGLKPPGSVLYVSFGSLARTNKQITLEIAYGLLLSQVNFIWVLRRDTTMNILDGADLPEGFFEEIKGKGFIVPWCNQKKVISDPAIGGFLTHCGWNSTLESIWCGVPMICYPYFADQTTNRKLVVDDWKIGINLCDGKSVTRDEVAEKIKILMNREASHGLSRESKKVKNILHDALDVNGSSSRNFDQFLNDLKAKIYAGKPI